MASIIVHLTKKADVNATLYKINNGLKTKEQAIIEILEEMK